MLTVCHKTVRMAPRLSMDAKTLRALHVDIRLTQERFCAAMEARFADIEADTLERYFALLSKLVEKLEDGSKSLGEVMNEMMGDAAAILLQMQARRP
jgi:hypothetical protein